MWYRETDRVKYTVKNEVFTLTGDVYDSKRVADGERAASQSAKGNLVELRETSVENGCQSETSGKPERS
jgi:hypothetical protein